MQQENLEAVFVYGTLKNGYTNHTVIAGPHTEYIGEFHTNPKYGLIDLGPYPAMVYGPHRVKGEAYFVSPTTLERLDLLEGVDRGLYRRRRIPIMNGDVSISAWVYTYNGIANQETVLLEEW